MTTSTAEGSSGGVSSVEPACEPMTFGGFSATQIEGFSLCPAAAAASGPCSASTMGGAVTASNLSDGVRALAVADGAGGVVYWRLAVQSSHSSSDTKSQSTPAAAAAAAAAALWPAGSLGVESGRGQRWQLPARSRAAGQSTPRLVTAVTLCRCVEI